MPFAPTWKFNVNGNYDMPLSNSWKAFVNSNYRWQSKVQYQLTQTPDTIQGAYGIWDAGVGVANANDGWRISLLVKNIANQSYSSYIAHGDLAGVVRWVPRDDSRYGGIDVHKSF